MGRILAGLFGMAAAAVALCGFAEVQASTAPTRSASDPGELVRVWFDSPSRQTRLAAHVSPDLCFSLALPQEWRAMTGGMETHLKSGLSDAELAVGLRPVHELRGLPQSDLASRDAALLQQDYENRLGRPAQSASLAFLSPGATRWSATWADAQLPAGFMTVETFIVPLSEDWVLELSVSNVDAKEEYDSLVHDLLTGLKVRRAAGCGGQMAS
jgi:hypothetical protein